MTSSGEMSFGEMWDALQDRQMYFDKQGQPITLERWGELRETGLDPGGGYGPDSYVRVGADTVGEAHVSTVWLGLDHGFGLGRDDDAYQPVIFETMIFGGKHDQAMMRYCTEQAAIKGHAEAVTDLRAGMPPWWAYGGQEDDEWRSWGNARVLDLDQTPVTAPAPRAARQLDLDGPA